MKFCLPDHEAKKTLLWKLVLANQMNLKVAVSYNIVCNMQTIKCKMAIYKRWMVFSVRKNAMHDRDSNPRTEWKATKNSDDRAGPLQYR